MGACTKKAPVDLSQMSEEQLKARGRQIYAQNCIACHNADPALDGLIGPAIKGSHMELLKMKVLTNKYPTGYTPKRQTMAMAALPALEKELPAIEAYLK